MDKQTRDEIFEGNVGLVYKVVYDRYKYFKDSAFWDDLIQEGMMELYRSIGVYEKDRGVAFSTFAYNNIYLRILKYVDTFIYQKKPFSKVVSKRKYKQVYESVELVSLNKPVTKNKKGTSSHATLADFIEGEFCGIEEVEDRILVENIIQFAEYLENTSTNFKWLHEIVQLRVKGLTSYEIGDKIGISKQTVLNRLNKFYEYYRQECCIA